MAISITFSVDDLLGDLEKTDQEAYAAIKNQDAASISALDGNEIWYEYLTQEDDKVRPSHAALHGTRWRADDPDAPTPPIDYGCRCFIRYISAPDSDASAILPEAAGPLSDKAEAFTDYLDENVEGWKSMATKANALPPADRPDFLVALLKADDVSGSVARDIANMILSVKWL